LKRKAERALVALVVKPGEDHCQTAMENTAIAQGFFVLQSQRTAAILVAGPLRNSLLGFLRQPHNNISHFGQ
jgi:hypothetical protein